MFEDFMLYVNDILMTGKYADDTTEMNRTAVLDKNYVNNINQLCALNNIAIHSK